MNLTVWIGGIFLVLMMTACNQQAQTDEGVAATLREPDYAGFERAYAPKPFNFPADHGPHPDYRDEWWYVTGNLDGPDGRRFGFQITFFRHGLKRGIPNRASHWAGQDANMAHFALTDVAGKKYTSFQRISRSGAGLAGAQAEPFKVWLDDWRMEASRPSGNAVELVPPLTGGRLGGNAVELAAEVGRNKPAPTGVSGKMTGQVPETVVARPYSGLQPTLNSTALRLGGGQSKGSENPPPNLKTPSPFGRGLGEGLEEGSVELNSTALSSSEGFPWHFRASQEGIELDLEMQARKPPVLNGNQGLSQKSAEPGNASYYYSITRMEAKGLLKLAGKAIPVKGLAWLDREWSTSMLADYQAGWDWFSLQLDDGTDLMFFRLRHKDGTDDPTSSGVLIAQDGHSTRLAGDEVSIKALGSWQSPAGGVYPSGWQLTIKPLNQVIEIHPVLADQEFRHDARYWEGAVDVVDAVSKKAYGRGYVELTGYAPGKVEKSGQ